MKQDFPRFDVTHRGEPAGILSGKVSAVRMGAETWVGDGHLGYLFDGESLTRGRWHEAEGDWGFMPTDGPPASAQLKLEQYVILDSYWGQLAEIVLDREHSWSPAVWSDSVDHDHCALCWSTIDSGNPRHRDNGRGSIVCPDCHDRYVEQGSLDFIQPHLARQERND